MHAARRVAGGRRALACALAVATLLPCAVAGAQRQGSLRRAPAGGVTGPTSAAISAADLRHRLFLFADDSMAGRATGSPEHLLATAYIASELERLGLEPAGDNGGFFQDLPLVSRGFVAGGTVRAGRRRFRLGEDFGATVARSGVVALPAFAQLVDGGELGDRSTYPARDSLEGRVVLLRPNRRSVSFGVRSMQVDEASHFAGAAAVVLPLWDDATPSVRRQLTGRSLTLRANTTQLPPTFVVSDAMFEALRARVGRPIALDVAFEERPAPARNVVAVLPGRDPALRAQYVALGAHSDHVTGAVRPVDHDSVRRTTPRPGPVRLDSIRNGADDDGSGTVALLEIAEALAAEDARPRRSILFAFHVGEELGLLGSGWFTDHPTVPRDSIVAQLNLDMVGRGGADDIKGGGPRYLQLIGARRLSRELGDLIDKVNASRDTPFAFDRSLDAPGHRANIYCRSDHAQYARYGIPVAFFSTGLHRDYHQVTDEPQYIDYAKLEAVTTLVRDVAVALADRAARPRLDRPRPDPKARCRQ